MSQMHSTSPRALGRRPHDPDRPVLRLSSYLIGAGKHASETIEHPASCDYLSQVPEWGMYSNDRFGDCGPTAVANQRRQITRYLGEGEQIPSEAEVFDLYKRAGNPDFDPATGVGDNGVVLADLCSALVKGGIDGTKAMAYAAVDVNDPSEVYAALGLFGSLLLGVDLDVAQDQQTEAGQPWDYVRNSKDWGGHCVLAGAYTGQTEHGAIDFQVITWAEVQGLTDAFMARQLAEAYVVIWPEHLGTKEFEQNVDLTKLAQDYEALTGRPFPSLPEPEPVAPEPTPEPAPTFPVDPAPTAPDLPTTPPADAPPIIPADPQARFDQALGVFMDEARRYLGSDQA